MAFTVFWGRPASVPHARQTKACDTGGFVSAAANCADQANAAVANPGIILARETQPEAGHESRRDSACEQAAPCSEEQAAFNHVSVAFARATGQLESVRALMNLIELLRGRRSRHIHWRARATNLRVGTRYVGGLVKRATLV